MDRLPPVGRSALAAVTIIARIALALLAARHRAASRADQPPRGQAAPDITPALGSDKMSRSIDMALQLGQIGIAALTVLEWLHHVDLL